MDQGEGEEALEYYDRGNFEDWVCYIKYPPDVFAFAGYD